jgi:hypothetical protein
MKSFLKNTLISLAALTVVVLLLPAIIKLAITNPEGLKSLPGEVKTRLSQI